MPARRPAPVAGLALGAAVLAAISGCTGSVPAAGAGWTFEPSSSGPTAAASPDAASATPSASADATPTAAVPSAEPSSAPTSPPPGNSVAFDPRADGLDVAFGEFAITLEASVIRPGPVTFVVHNAGNLVHGFELRPEHSGGGSGGDRPKIETRRFQSGETLRVEANLTPGIYEIECYVADHEERGMKTYIEVREDAPLATPEPGGSAPDVARIVQFAFVPATLSVPVGTTVSWRNDDPAPHTVTSADGIFDSQQLDQGGSYSVVFDRPGVYRYRCEIHPTMVGEVRVD